MDHKEERSIINVSREGLTDFLHSVQHSSSLRREMEKCKDDNELLKLAQNLGYSISQSDLNDSSKYEDISQWFKVSRINPIKR